MLNAFLSRKNLCFLGIVLQSIGSKDYLASQGSGTQLVSIREEGHHIFDFVLLFLFGRICKRLAFMEYLRNSPMAIKSLVQFSLSCFVFRFTCWNGDYDMTCKLRQR